MIRKPTIAKFFVCLLVFGTSHQAAHAGFISTESAGQLQYRAVLVSDLEARFAEEQVKAALLKLGVAPEQVHARLAALTDAELVQLSEKMESLPAGAGVIEVVGVVFLVLLILELVGVTDVFTAI